MAVNNLANYTDKDGLGFPLNFRRGNPNPHDNSSLWASFAAAQAYAQSDATAYVGQVLTVLDAEHNTAIVYVIEKEDGTLKQVGTVTLVDGTTIVKNADNVISIKGYEEAAEGAQLIKTADGLSWVVPSTETVDGLRTAVAAIQKTLGDSTKGLVKQVNDNTAAISVLNGDETKEGSVAYQIAQIVAGADQSFDTLKEIADWIKTHGTTAAEMQANISTNTADIDALEALVGDSAVATQIADAIAAALKNGEADKYALAADLTALSGKVTTDSGTLKTHVENTDIHVTAEDKTKWNAAQANVLEGIASSSLKVSAIANKNVTVDIEWGTF